jgi:hypothetical protein
MSAPPSSQTITAHVIGGISVSTLSLGVAIVGPKGTLLPSPVGIAAQGTSAVERVRLSARVELFLLRHDVRLLVLLGEERDERRVRVEHLVALVREAAERHHIPVFELTRSAVAAHLGARGVSNAAICDRLRETVPMVRDRIGVASPAGRRVCSARERYWQTSILAYGAASFAAIRFARRVPD